MEKAIALLEVQAMVTAIVGLDAMIKAADVKLIHVEKRLGGRLVTVVVEGSVSAVQAAADAGKAAAAEVGNVKLCEVIARPHPEVMKFLRTDPIP
ncbi:MAG: BMC domain-containing protein [Clostridia bacterium]|jgi:microcompartment protein CcmL/EutN|nr:BMC domain-containing protein [Clostridia bacterium]MBQ7910666.1 BMC domain-containing protein [Clostridia bacterium]